jgi:hypothetical protein
MQVGNIFPMGMPKGPWNSFEEAQHSLNIWSTALVTVPFKIIRVTQRNESGKKGPTQSFRCNFYGKPSSARSKKCNCKFQIHLEKKSKGIVVSKMGAECLRIFNLTNCWHGNLHEGFKVREQIDNSSNFNIPQNILDEIHVLLKTNMAPKDMYWFAIRQCRNIQLPVNFTYDDFYNKYCRDYKPMMQRESDDVLSLLDLLRQWVTKDQKRVFYTGYDNDCHLNKIFVCMDQKHSIFTVVGKKVVLFDTKYRNNRYGLALGCFVTIDEFGNTHVIAASLVESESKEFFSWVFTKFKECFGTVPKVIITDGDTTMADVIAKLWPETTHLLCAWHIFKNFYEHIHRYFCRKR